MNRSLSLLFVVPTFRNWPEIHEHGEEIKGKVLCLKVKISLGLQDDSRCTKDFKTFVQTREKTSEIGPRAIGAINRSRGPPSPSL
jgi:hypothetical protein